MSISLVLSRNGRSRIDMLLCDSSLQVEEGGRGGQNNLWQTARVSRAEGSGYELFSRGPMFVPLLKTNPSSSGRWTMEGLHVEFVLQSAEAVYMWGLFLE